MDLKDWKESQSEEECKNNSIAKVFNKFWQHYKPKQNDVVDIELNAGKYSGEVFHFLISKYYNGTYFATNLINGKTVADANNVEDLGVMLPMVLPRPTFDDIECTGEDLMTNYPSELINQMKKALGQAFEDKEYTDETFAGFLDKQHVGRGHVVLIESQDKIHQVLISLWGSHWLATELKTGETISEATNQSNLALGIASRLKNPHLLAQIDNPFEEKDGLLC